MCVICVVSWLSRIRYGISVLSVISQWTSSSFTITWIYAPPVQCSVCLGSKNTPILIPLKFIACILTTATLFNPTKRYEPCPPDKEYLHIYFPRRDNISIDRFSFYITTALLLLLVTILIDFFIETMRSIVNFV